MKVIDSGHEYELAHLDGEGTSRLTFVKREGEGYPGNVGAHEGTNIQEVLRALIEHLRYLDWQVPDERNGRIIERLRASLYLLEERAAERHNRKPPHPGTTFPWAIEREPTCAKCGHVGCDDKHQ